MKNFFKIFFYIIFAMYLSTNSFSKENFYNEGIKFFKDKKYDDAKFSFERSIVYDPKLSDAYLYLAKIYKKTEDKKNEKKNLETTLLIDPNNEEALLMMMDNGLKDTDYSKVKELSERFTKVCKKLCDENKKILKELSNLEPNNES